MDEVIKKGRFKYGYIILLLLCFCLGPIVCTAQTNDLTYQGRLVDGTIVASGGYDFVFRLFDDPEDPVAPQIGPDQVRGDVVLTGGIFSVVLNFGSTAFDGGGERYLEIYVRPGASTGAYAKLTPRQRVTSAPFSIRSSKADSLSAACALCVTNAQIFSLDGAKVTGTVANAATATTATSVSGIVQIANGGTGSSTKTFVDLSTDQTGIAGNKTFTGILSGNGAGLTNVPGTLKWQTVAGPIQAEANKGYLVTGEVTRNITLPENTNLNEGDVIRVSGSGTGGWKIFGRIGQSFVGSGFNAVIGWMPVGDNGNWQSIASDTFGEKLILAERGGQLYTSSNSGLSFFPKESNRNWSGVASSADGNNLAAVVEGGQIYTSADSGFTWTPRDSNRLWRGIASSADGSKLVAVATTIPPSDPFGDNIYTSTDSGSSWTLRAPKKLWNSVASSADGSKLVASAMGFGFTSASLWTSTDSGVNWTQRISVFNDISQVASSSDGTKLVAAGNNGQILTSSDSGATWTGRESSRAWAAVASSTDGTRLIAVVAGGRIYASADSGITWTPTESDRSWSSVTCSADCSIALAVVFAGGRIYRMANPFLPPPPISRLSGGQYTSVELQYMGDGKFFLVGQQGTITGTQF